MKPASLDNKQIINRILLFICPAMVLMMVISALLSGDGADTVQYFAWSALLVEILVLYVPARLFINKRGGGKSFGLKKISVSEWVWAILLGVGMFFLTTALNGLMSVVWDALHIPLIDSNAALYAGGGWRLAASVLLVVIIPAYAEEMLFRGALLFSWLPHNRTRAIFHSAMIFALFHAQPMSLIPLFVMGLALAVISAKTESCYPAMAVHGINNLIALLIVNLPSGDITDTAEAATGSTLMLTILIYAVVGIGISLLCYQGLKRAAVKRQGVTKLLPAQEDEEKGTAAQATEEGKSAVREGQQADGEETKRSDGHAGASSLPVILTYILLGIFNAFFMAAVYMQPLT